MSPRPVSWKVQSSVQYQRGQGWNGHSSHLQCPCGLFDIELVAAHAFDSICRHFGVPEADNNQDDRTVHMKYRQRERKHESSILLPDAKRTKYLPIGTMRLPVEQLDPETGQVLARSDFKTEAAAAHGNKKSSGVLGHAEFETEATFAFGFFWRPEGSVLMPKIRLSRVTKAVDQLHPTTGKFIKRFDSCSSNARGVQIHQSFQEVYPMG